MTNAWVAGLSRGSGADEGVRAHIHLSWSETRHAASLLAAQKWKLLRSLVREVLLHGDLEVNELVAFGVVDPSEVEGSSGERIANAGDIEEDESRLAGVRLDGAGQELGALDLVLDLFLDGFLRLAMR